MTKKALILTWDGFQDQEVIYPYYRVQEAGFKVDICANLTLGKVKGIFGVEFENSKTITSITGPVNYILDEYTLLIIPGGVKALEKLRQYSHALDFIKKWDDKNKIISSTCHGAQMLISAKIVKGREISGYYSIKDDIENAGATYIDAPAVVDKNIISSPHYKHMGEWMKVTLEEYNKWETLTKIK